MGAERPGHLRQHGSLALAFAGLALLARPASAEPHEVLIVGAGSPELVRKLRAETAYAGFHPVEAAPGSRAPATLRVLSSERVELSVQDADLEQRFQQTLVSRPDERDAFALRVVEQLRARLADVGWALPVERETTSPEPAQLPPPSGTASSSSAELGARPAADAGPAPDEAGPSRAGRVWLDTGIAGSWASGGLGAVPHAALGAQLELGASWLARATSLWPLRDGELAADEGLATVAWTGFSGTLGRELDLPEPWLAQVGVGGGLIVLDARGVARDGFSGRRERLYAGAYFAEISLGRELSSWLRWRATLAGGITGPRPVLRFDQREVATVGRFIGSLTLGLDLTWPGEAR